MHGHLCGLQIYKWIPGIHRAVSMACLKRRWSRVSRHSEISIKAHTQVDNSNLVEVSKEHIDAEGYSKQVIDQGSHVGEQVVQSRGRRSSRRGVCFPGAPWAR